MHAEVTTEANGVVSRRSLLIGAVGAGVLPILSHHAFARSVETPAMKKDERLMREAIAEAKLWRLSLRCRYRARWKGARQRPQSRQAGTRPNGPWGDIGDPPVPQDSRPGEIEGRHHALHLGQAMLHVYGGDYL